MDAWMIDVVEREIRRRERERERRLDEAWAELRESRCPRCGTSMWPGEACPTCKAVTAD